MLDRMDQKEPRAWADVIDELRQSWNEALKAANPRAALLHPEARDTFKTAVSVLAEMLLDLTSADFKVESWPRVLHWAEELRDGKVPVDFVDAASEMRDVVNAAWMARAGLRNPKLPSARTAPTGWETDRKQIADIAEKATKLRDSILKKRDQTKKDPDTQYGARR
jgi:hypothetical protein